MTRPSENCRVSAHEYLRDHFPDMKGVRPSVSSRKSGGQTRYRFTFRKALRSSDGERFRQIVNVTTDEEGNVVKVSVSR
jgi:hypothetical protein